MLRVFVLAMAVFCLRAQEDVTFKAGVSLVHVDGAVTTPDGRFLTGLTRDDFRVFDEHKEQKLVAFSAGEEALDLVVVFDISGSMLPKVREVANAAKIGFQELRHGDRVCVMVFNTRTRILLPFTEDLDLAERTIEIDVPALRFGGGTFLQSAVDEAAQRLMHQPRTNRRRAVLVITDNYGQRTRREGTVIKDFWEADALLTALIVRSMAVETVHNIGILTNPATLALQVGVKGITAKTGGDFIHSDDAGAAFQDAMHRIRSRYSLYYALPQAKPGATRSVHVELTPDALKRYPKSVVRARTGYVVPADTKVEPKSR